MNFTERAIERLQATDTRQTFRDDTTPGLGLRIEPSNVGARKSFFYNAKVGGRVVHKAIGETASISVKDARDKAKKLAAHAVAWKEAGFPDVLAGNPFASEPIPEQASAAPTFSVLVERYIQEHLHGKETGINNPDRAERHLRYQLDRYFADWMQKPVDQISVEDVIKLRDAAGERRYAGKRSVSFARTLFGWCAGAEDGKVNVWPLPSNPAAKIKLADDNERERWLSPSELVILEAALDDKATPRYLADFVRLALDTAARKDSIVSMRWNDVDVDLKQWRIPSGRSKSGEAYTVDLQPRALKIIERRRRERTSTSDYVFAAAWGARGFVYMDRPFRELIARCGLKDVRIHDLRRSAATYMARANEPLQKIAATLGHSERNIDSVLIYARLAQADLPATRAAGANKMREEMAVARKRMEKQKTVRSIAGGAR